MDVSFIIPVYNQLEHTKECLRSLQDTVGDLEYEIILVDDFSSEETETGLKELANERVKIIRNACNMGYAYSNNIGALNAKGALLFLLNNDLVLLEGWFEPMRKAFSKLKRVGLVGNVQLSFATGEIDHAGVFVATDTTIEHKRAANKGLFRSPAYTRVHMITAACCAIPRSLFMEVGGFDEAFLNGGEDIDLCFRVRALGYHISVANKSVVKHHVSATRSGKNLNTEINSRLLQRKWSTLLARHAASGWPDEYLANCLKSQSWATVNSKLLKDALARFLMLKKGPAPTALTIAECEMERKERHWRSILDGWSDERIKSEERKMHASPLNDSYQFNGLYPSEDRAGVWIREKAQLELPRGMLISSISVSGNIYTADPILKEEQGTLGLAITVNGSATKTFFPIETGLFSIEFPTPPVKASEIATIELTLLGTSRANTYAYLGRKLAKNALVPKPIRERLGSYRPQKLNRRLCIEGLQVNGEDVFNFALDPTNPLNTDYAIRHANLGINLVGWYKAQLGIGESVRLAAKAVKAINIPHAIVPLRVNCLAAQGDSSLDDQFTDENPYPVNVFHIDAPQSADIDHHHGPAFRKGKRNIAYWAWELPEFPDRWIKYFRYFDEIWTPSNFVRDAIAMKSPVPVVTMPHCIDFDLPGKDWRAELGLPEKQFLFCFAYDLNSYQERKNPRAIIEAYRQAFAGKDTGEKVGLVIKIHSTENNKKQYEQLLELLDGLPNCHLIDRTLSREATYGLMKACDCYVSLHRAEGFGLTVAESMYLGKPVISTNWSATSEFVNSQNGCPVNFKLIKLTQDFGPYEKGQLWADPDPSHAAEYMKRLVSEPGYAQQLGENAQRTIKELYSPERIAGLYRNRLRALALW
ncbi:glycosyltransferase [Pelagicoccus albus]|uniref:Glycosyltransferase n=1 Tax=Pelagicoccus albus TaxID=415222 RepID=A0A7X1E8B9_9BACT|nr:glycosyltransferase [Pelagicoccus albus]MBC2605988.1 glycosyltransferase [Pelagicoccus albus]